MRKYAEAEQMREFGFVTTGEIAEALGVHRATILSRITKGDIPAIELPPEQALGSHRRFVDPHAFLAKGILIVDSPAYRAISALASELPVIPRELPTNLRVTKTGF